MGTSLPLKENKGTGRTSGLGCLRRELEEDVEIETTFPTARIGFEPKLEPNRVCRNQQPIAQLRRENARPREW